MRIIAGAARGRRLQAPKGMATRPTSDRVREAVFSTLAARAGQRPVAHVLDLFAGSGSMGLEALSRGAQTVVFVESDPRACRTLRDNVALVGLPGATVITADVEKLSTGSPDRWGELADQGPANCVLCDPPYAMPAVRIGEVLRGLQANGWLSHSCEVVVERGARDRQSPWPAFDGFAIEEEDRRVYGDSALWYGRLVSPASPSVRSDV